MQIQKWAEQAKVHASNDMQLPIAQFAYLDLKLDQPFEVLDVEDAFERIWVAVSHRRSASDMAKVRLAMFELLGEQRQRELIEKWTR